MFRQQRKAQRFRLQLSGGDTFDLEIQDVRVADSSEYRCEVDVMGRPLSINFTLKVMLAPQPQVREQI